MERQVAQEERDQALEKARESSILLKGEKKKRLQLEDKITQRLCRGGGYKLEGLDAAIVPDGVVAYELEEANRHVRETSEEASRIAKKLEVERQEKEQTTRKHAIKKLGARTKKPTMAKKQTMAGLVLPQPGDKSVAGEAFGKLDATQRDVLTGTINKKTNEINREQLTEIGKQSNK